MMLPTNAWQKAMDAMSLSRRLSMYYVKPMREDWYT
jgi:hypothetical protein